jgi:cytochrome c-type biogenesis protein CcmH
VLLSLACAPALHAQDNETSAEGQSSTQTSAPAPVFPTAEGAARIVPEDYAENYAFSDPNQRKTFLKLTGELRCPQCQNQNIADSDAPIAHDMRRKVYQLMREGNDEAEVISWMKARYGDFVHYQPPVNAFTVWLWLAPVLFAFIMLLVFIKRRKAVDDVDIEARLARADQLLKDE